MKYVFFGTPRFAAIVLEGLLEGGMPPAALVCNPDRPVGRKHVVTPPPTKQLLHGKNIPILQPEKLDSSFIETLHAFEPDFFVVAAYAKIIPKAVLAAPRLGTLGVHPSLLPKYRGSSPIQSVILAGEKETGVTIYHMDEKVDHGAIFEAATITLDALKTNYLDLEEELAEIGAKLLLEIGPELLKGNAKPKPQDESRATLTKKFTTADGNIPEKDLTEAEQGNKQKAERIVRKINALGVEPGVWTMRNGKRVKLLEAEIKNGALRLSKIQEEGGTPKSL